MYQYSLSARTQQSPQLGRRNGPVTSGLNPFAGRLFGFRYGFRLIVSSQQIPPKDCLSSASSELQSYELTSAGDCQRLTYFYRSAGAV